MVCCSKQTWIAITVSSQRVQSTATTPPVCLFRLFPVTSLPVVVPGCAPANLVATRWITIRLIRSLRPSTMRPRPTPGPHHPNIDDGRRVPESRRRRGRRSAGLARRHPRRVLSRAVASSDGGRGRPLRRRPASGRRSAMAGRRRWPLRGSPPPATRPRPDAKQTLANQPSTLTRDRRGLCSASRSKIPYENCSSTSSNGSIFFWLHRYIHCNLIRKHQQYSFVLAGKISVLKSLALGHCYR